MAQRRPSFLRPRQDECFPALHNVCLTRPDATTAAEHYLGQTLRAMFAALVDAEALHACASASTSASIPWPIPSLRPPRQIKQESCPHFFKGLLESSPYVTPPSLAYWQRRVAQTPQGHPALFNLSPFFWQEELGNLELLAKPK